MRHQPNEQEQRESDIEELVSLQRRAKAGREVTACMRTEAEVLLGKTLDHLNWMDTPAHLLLTKAKERAAR